MGQWNGVLCVFLTVARRTYTVHYTIGNSITIGATNTQDNIKDVEIAINTKELMQGRLENSGVIDINSFMTIQNKEDDFEKLNWRTSYIDFKGNKNISTVYSGVSLKSLQGDSYATERTNYAG